MDRVDGDRSWTVETLGGWDEGEGPAAPLPTAALPSRLADIAAALPAALYVTDRSGALTFYNEAAAALWEARPPLGQPGWWRGWRLVRADGTPLDFAASPLAAPAQAGASPSPAEAASRGSDGTIRSFLVLRTPLAAGETLTLLIDITSRAADEERYRYTVALSAHLPWTATADGQLIEVDPRWLAITGMRREDALGMGASATVHLDEADRVAAMWKEAARSGAPIDLEHRVRTADGSYRWFRSRAHARRGANGEVLGWYGTTEDIHERHLAADEVRWTAEHDALTELPNRRTFRDRLDATLAEAAATGRTAGLLLLDIDHFKQVNDQLGHDAGDLLLQTFANRLRSAVGDNQQVARLGGDEFAVILSRVRDPRTIERHAERLLARLAVPFEYRGHIHDCRASIGAAIYPRDGRHGSELLKSADIALYEAKTSGRGRVQTFRSTMRADLQRRASMMSVARDALKRRAIAPFYQPKVNLASGRLCGFEALLRWRHERNGWLLPGAILAAFEDLELAVQLSDAMLDGVIQDIGRWHAAGIDPGRIAVNASAAELRRPDYAERVLAKLKAASLPGAVLELEVTEMVFFGRGTGHIGETLSALCAAGVTIALDDFGTGFASLSHLKQFPVDVIKIDRSFIAELDKGPEDLAILRALIGLGRNLGIATVAEGIETRQQAARLRLEGCTIGQGFLFGPAVPAADLPALIQNWQPQSHRARRNC